MCHVLENEEAALEEETEFKILNVKCFRETVKPSKNHWKWFIEALDQKFSTSKLGRMTNERMKSKFF
ncbi:hypothetical protein QR680_017790 [Steinernema hermaphroditum]|uniref:Uncharacterized protein n=1 Tax=Steinernema hermaphroditum TaxID=289476 RepID=A0AA39LPR3_9BILA|nr:hypothetical protein QR680_017790 [Steinernema hermaphroditum]